MAGEQEHTNADILNEFVAEVRETLERVEPLVVELEQGGGAQPETLAVIFRFFHSFKGTASFLDLPIAAGLAHSAESLLDLFRRGAPIEGSHIDLVCQTLDTFKHVLDAIETDGTDASKATECSDLALLIHAVVAELRSALGIASSRRDKTIGAGPTRVSGASTRVQSVKPEGDDDLNFFVESTRSSIVVPLPDEFLVKFVAESEEHLAKVEEVLVALESGGASDEQLADAFRAMHSFKGNCGICGYADMEKLTHRAETLMGEFRDKRRKPDESSVSLLLECLDVLRVALSGIPGGDAGLASLASLLGRMNLLTLQRQPSAHATGSELGINAPDHGDGRPVARDAGGTKGQGGSIRVDTEKLDDLMNLVGELIIAETTVTQNPDLEGHEFENFQKAAVNLNRLTRALQDIAMAVRMVPIAATFRKMVRLVRDVSTKQGKRVELILSGEGTEVDKTVVETIADPLVHLIRNSIDHGIEAPEERAQSSKDSTGSVWLDAKHQGGEVWITVRDDGRGLNPERILEKALERGLADPNRRYSDREVFEFIFAAGFSTAPKVTEISGRGVGMDVVRRNIEGVNGKVEVTSELGRGTLFTLRIPLTLAIIEGMLVRVGTSFYTIPLLAIRESVKAQPSDITCLSDGEELLKLRRQHYPIVKLSRFYSAGSSGVTSALDGILVIVESADRLACVLVDEVLGQRQTVVKALPEYVKRVPGLAGCSILHNGDISLILDVKGLVGSADSQAA